MILDKKLSIVVKKSADIHGFCGESYLKCEVASPQNVFFNFNYT